MVKGIRNIRTQIMDYFNHIIKILDIGIISELKRALQTACMQITRYLLRMKDLTLSTMEFKKGNVMIPVPNYQIASLRLFIESFKYKTKAGDPIYDFKSLTQ